MTSGDTTPRIYKLWFSYFLRTYLIGCWVDLLAVFALGDVQDCQGEYIPPNGPEIWCIRMRVGRRDYGCYCVTCYGCEWLEQVLFGDSFKTKRSVIYSRLFEKKYLHPIFGSGGKIIVAIILSYLYAKVQRDMTIYSSTYFSVSNTIFTYTYGYVRGY